MSNSSQGIDSGAAPGQARHPSGSSPQGSASPAPSLEEAASDLFVGLDLSPVGSEVLVVARPVLAVSHSPCIIVHDLLHTRLPLLLGSPSSLDLLELRLGDEDLDRVRGVSPTRGSVRMLVSHFGE